jgi:tRNA threonylcarbamoyladenosine biosynthesis protein TsaB
MVLARILALDAVLGRASVAVLDGDAVSAQRVIPGPHGVAEALPAAVAACLAEAGIAASQLDAIAVTIGPGSFTGLRASIALAEGLGSTARVPVHGMSLTETFMAQAASQALPPGRPLWIAITARRGRIFLERDGQVESLPDDALPRPEGPVAVAGDQAIPVTARLAAAGCDVLLTSLRYPDAAAVGLAARAKIEAGAAPRRAAPRYVDPPEAKLPGGGLRPAPV